MRDVSLSQTHLRASGPRTSLFSNDASPGLGIRDASRQDKQIKHRRRWQSILLALALLMVTVALVWLGMPHFSAWFSQDTLVPRTQLRFAEVSRGPLVRDVAVQGSVVAAKSPTLFSLSAGQVHLFVEPGDRVAEGDILARVNSPSLRSSLAQEQASLQSLDTDLKRLALENRRQMLLNQQQIDLLQLSLQAAQREFERAEQSRQRDLISAQDFAAAEDAYKRAQVEAKHIRAESALSSESLQFDLQAKTQVRERQALKVTELQRQLAALEIRSPVSGMVGDLLVEQRADVQESTPLLSVVDLRVLEVDARVAESYGSQLRTGMVASIRFSNAEHPAVISAIAPKVEAGEVALRLRFSQQQPEGLRQNQRLSGRIILQHIDSTLRVERGGFLQAEGGHFAYKVEGERATRVPIEIGATSIAYIEITGGLQAGDTIIISNTQEYAGVTTLRLMNY